MSKIQTINLRDINLDLMDSMHDSYVSKIYVEDNYLFVFYDNIDEGVLDNKGNPYYKNKSLLIEYKFYSYCEFTTIRKRKIYNIKAEEISRILEYKNTKLRSFLYKVNSFYELELVYESNNKRLYKLIINLDPIEINYNWND